MTPLPSLAKWERTSHSLHEAAMLLGAIRQLAFPARAELFGAGDARRA